MEAIGAAFMETAAPTPVTKTLHAALSAFSDGDVEAGASVSENVGSTSSSSRNRFGVTLAATLTVCPGGVWVWAYTNVLYLLAISSR